jgi:transcriptional regulator with XRE-family HTH domain
MSLVDLRKRRGLTQTALANRAGLNIRAIQKIEYGEVEVENLTGRSLKSIAAALNVSIEELL